MWVVGGRAVQESAASSEVEVVVLRGVNNRNAGPMVTVSVKGTCLNCMILVKSVARVINTSIEGVTVC